MKVSNAASARWTARPTAGAAKARVRDREEGRKVLTLRSLHSSLI
jgi:hypothetical protein